MNCSPCAEQRRVYACRRGVLRVRFTLALTEAKSWATAAIISSEMAIATIISISVMPAGRRLRRVVSRNTFRMSLS